jgi:hypothetical protein
MSLGATLFLWLLLAIVTYTEHKAISKLKQDLSLLVVEAEIKKRQREDLLKKLME